MDEKVKKSRSIWLDAEEINRLQYDNGGIRREIISKWKEADNETVRDWDISFYIRGTAAEAEDLYNALQALICTCQDHGDGCRTPVSGMRPKELKDDE